MAFGGVIWFAYQNGKNGSGGMPPLVRAETGPTKVKPENPGGQEIPFQDSTVYDRLDQNGQKRVVEKLLPETEAPVTRPPPPPAPAPQNEATALAPQAGGAAPTALAQGNGIVVAPPPPPPFDGSATALAPSAAVVASPPALPAPQAAPVAQQASLPAPQAAPPAPQAAPPAQQAAPSASQAVPPAQAAPQPLVAMVPSPRPAAPPPAAKGKPAPDSIGALIGASEASMTLPPPGPAGAAGGYRLRLSAVRSQDEVAGEWARLKRRFPELASLQSSTSKFDMPDKGTFYRIDAGPLNASDAKSTCDRLRTQGLGCIVLKP
jgi:hypothetical protein